MIRATEIVESQEVASGVLPDGRRFKVSEVTYSNPLKGLGDTGTVLDIEGTVNVPGESIGFSDQADAERYLTSRGHEEYTTYDDFGNEIQERRAGLSVPDGMISRENKTDSRRDKDTPNHPVDVGPTGPTGVTGNTGFAGTARNR